MLDTSPEGGLVATATPDYPPLIRVADMACNLPSLDLGAQRWFAWLIRVR